MSITLAFDASDATTSGLALQLHYDSTKLAFVGVADVLPTSLVGVQDHEESVSDEDPDTDRTVVAGWLGENWPGSVPQTLLTVQMLTAEDFTGSTSLHLTGESPVGFAFLSSSATVTASKLDVDANGLLGPLSDGSLILRYLFGFSGPSLVSGAVGPDCKRCDAPTITTYLAGLGLVLDIDGNGTLGPLSDGLMILRFLFGFSGATLVSDPMAPNCTRCDVPAITEYLESL